MITLLTALHIFICILLVVIVLLQHGKGADMGATFGGASQTVFGARGAATFLSKLTAGVAITFMVTSLSLAYLSAHESSKSVFSSEESETGAKETPGKGTEDPATKPAKAPTDKVKDSRDIETKPAK